MKKNSGTRDDRGIVERVPGSLLLTKQGQPNWLDKTQEVLEVQQYMQNRASSLPVSDAELKDLIEKARD